MSNTKYDRLKQKYFSYIKKWVYWQKLTKKIKKMKKSTVLAVVYIFVNWQGRSPIRRRATVVQSIQSDVNSEWLVELKSDGSERIIYEKGFAHTENRLRLPSAKEEVMQDVYKWIKEDFVIYPSNLNNKPDDLIMNEEKTYVASFDNCKDQNEIYTFVQEYLKFAEKRKIQLIVTTNATNLMDLKLLRRDEIWFISRRRTKNHSIYSLDEFDDRFDKNLEIAYLDGRFNVI